MDEFLYDGFLTSNSCETIRARTARKPSDGHLLALKGRAVAFVSHMMNAPGRILENSDVWLNPHFVYGWILALSKGRKHLCVCHALNLD